MDALQGCHMQAHNCAYLPSLNVGQRDVDLTVKATRAQDCRVEDVHAVRSSHDDDGLFFRRES